MWGWGEELGVLRIAGTCGYWKNQSWGFVEHRIHGGFIILVFFNPQAKVVGTWRVRLADNSSNSSRVVLFSWFVEW